MTEITLSEMSALPITEEMQNFANAALNAALEALMETEICSTQWGFDYRFGDRFVVSEVTNQEVLNNALVMALTDSITWQLIKWFGMTPAEYGQMFVFLVNMIQEEIVSLSDLPPEAGEHFAEQISPNGPIHLERTSCHRADCGNPGCSVKVVM